MNNDKIHVINLKDDDAIPELAKLLSRIFGEEAKKKSEREALGNKLADADYKHIFRLCAIADKDDLHALHCDCCVVRDILALAR